jgi:TonB family protein
VTSTVSLLVCMIVIPLLGSDSATWRVRRLHSMGYPEEALRLGVSGTVLVRCELSGDGSVFRANVLSGQKLLATPAVRNAGTWTFARVKGGADFVVTLTYVFEIVDSRLAADNFHTQFVFEYPSTVLVNAGVRDVR